MPVLPDPEAVSLEPDLGTVGSLVDDVFTHLEASSFGVLNRLGDDIDADDTTLIVDFDNQAAVRPGAYLCVDIEVVYVWDYDPATKTATVQRGMLGSTAAAHDDGALIQVQPRVSKFDVLKELRNEIRAWPPALYRIATVPITRNALARAYNLDAASLYRVLEVRHTATDAPPVSVSGYRVDFDADSDAYPAGKAIVFADAASSGVSDVVYAAPFITAPWDLTTSLNDVGLTQTLVDIPVLGAAARLVREAPRTDTRAQGQSRLAEEVPPMHSANASKDLMRRRDDRIHQEIARLREKYPQRRA